MIHITLLTTNVQNVHGTRILHKNEMDLIYVFLFFLRLYLPLPFNAQKVHVF